MNLIYGVIGTYALSNCSGSSLAKKQFFRKITPSLFFDKASCTRQFESELSLHSLASLFPLKEGSTSHPDPLSSGAREKTALLGARNRYALRLADHQRSSPCCAGWDRLGIAVCSLQLIVYSLRLISWLFADNLQISCGFLGGFEKKAYFCGKVERLKRRKL